MPSSFYNWQCEDPASFHFQQQGRTGSGGCNMGRDTDIELDTAMSFKYVDGSNYILNTVFGGMNMDEDG
jgi:hypothetical protein